MNQGPGAQGGVLMLLWGMGHHYYTSYQYYVMHTKLLFFRSGNVNTLLTLNVSNLHEPLACELTQTMSV